jgi:hypothetical protein
MAEDDKKEVEEKRQIEKALTDKELDALTRDNIKAKREKNRQLRIEKKLAQNLEKKGEAFEDVLYGPKGQDGKRHLRAGSDPNQHGVLGQAQQELDSAIAGWASWEQVTMELFHSCLRDYDMVKSFREYMTAEVQNAMQFSPKEKLKAMMKGEEFSDKTQSEALHVNVGLDDDGKLKIHAAEGHGQVNDNVGGEIKKTFLQWMDKNNYSYDEDTKKFTHKTTGDELTPGSLRQLDAKDLLDTFNQKFSVEVKPLLDSDLSSDEPAPPTPPSPFR